METPPNNDENLTIAKKLIGALINADTHYKYKEFNCICFAYNKTNLNLTSGINGPNMIKVLAIFNDFTYESYYIPCTRTGYMPGWKPLYDYSSITIKTINFYEIPRFYLEKSTTTQHNDDHQINVASLNLEKLINDYKLYTAKPPSGGGGKKPVKSTKSKPRVATTRKKTQPRQKA